MLGLAVVWGVCQATINGAYAGVTATIPDQVPVRQRGLVSGWVGLAQTVGVVLGVALVSFVVTGLDAGIVHDRGAARAPRAAVRARHARTHRSTAHERPPFELGPFLARFWVSPREYPDFAWAWITRFLMMLGNAMATLYLLFFLQDAVKVEDAKQVRPC